MTRIEEIKYKLESLSIGPWIDTDELKTHLIKYDIPWLLAELENAKKGLEIYEKASEVTHTQLKEANRRLEELIERKVL